MRITSWNINSIRARKDHVITYLKSNSPDVLMVQELKSVDFPHEEFKSLGYETAAVTQKTYNGVAVLSKNPIHVISDKLPGDKSDEQARFIEFESNGLRLINVYCPNGNPVESEKYPYKMDWMKRLKAHLKDLLKKNIEFVIGGDFNVIPEPKDCHCPQSWKKDALFRIETRRLYRSITNLGLADAFRAFHSEDENYTFWDYQAGAWPKNNGIRIDHFLLSPGVADRLLACDIDSAPRGWTKPSDHTPITVKIRQ